MDDFASKKNCMSVACKSVENSVEKPENHQIVLPGKKEDFDASNQSMQTKHLNENLQSQSEADHSSSSSSQANVTYSSSNNATYNNCSNVNGMLTTGSNPLTTQHYYSQIFNNSQSLLRPLMTTQPPLYSPILASQQHSYALPHPSPSSSSFPGLSDSIRTIDSIPCSSETMFKDVTHSRLNGEAINSNEKSCSLQNSAKHYPVDPNQKRTNAQNSCNLTRYSSCSEGVLKHNNVSEQQQMFEEYVRIYGEDANCRSWGESSSSATMQNSSSHHRNNSYVAHQPGTSLNVHGYSDCRLDPSWNRYISDQSSNCISESYTVDNTSSYSKHLIKGYSTVTNSGNHNVAANAPAEHNLGRSHYEYQPISAGQLASLLTSYIQPVSYQHSQDCRSEYRATDLRANENQCEINVNTDQTSTSEVSKKQIEMGSSHANDSASTTSQVIAIVNNENAASHSLASSSHLSTTSHNQDSSLAAQTSSTYQQSPHSVSKQIQDKKIVVPSTSQVSGQSASSCQAATTNKVSVKSSDNETQENFKKQNKGITEEGNNVSFFCLLCGESVNDSPTHSQIDNIITYASKISINEKLTLMIGYPLPRDMLPSQSICPKCFRLINEVDVLENRLNVCRREVLLSIESMFERNGIHFSPYKRFHRQQYVGSYQHPEMQHATYQCLGTNVIGSHNGHSSYQNDAQNYQSLNHIYPVHNQSNQTHLMQQSQMHLSQNYHNNNSHLHSATLVHSNHGQEQQTHVDESHLNNHQESHSQIQQHQANQVQDNLLKGHIQHDITKIPLGNDSLKQQQHHQSQHQLQTTSVQTQPLQQETHQQLLNLPGNAGIPNHQLQSQPSQHSNLPSSIQTHSLTQESSQIQQVTQHSQQNFSKHHEQVSFHSQRSHLDHSHQYQDSSAVTMSQAIHNNHVHVTSISSKPNDNIPHQQAVSTYQPHILSRSEPSTKNASHSLEHSLHSKDVIQTTESSGTVLVKDKPKADNPESASLLVESNDHIPLILPETSSDLDTHQMSVLLSYQQSNEKSLNSELLESNFGQSYINVTSIDASMGQSHSDTSIEKNTDSVHSVEKEFPKVQDIDVENWPSCNGSAIENVSKSIPSNHPECDIDIEECDNIIENVSTEKSTECNNEIFSKVGSENTIVASQSSVDISYEPKTNTENNLCSDSNDNPLPPSTSESNELGEILLQPPLSPPPPPIGPPEGLRNVQDATEYHKPTLLGKNIKVKKHAKLQICRQCDQVFSNRQALIRHIERRHKNFSLNYSCDTCHRKFYSEKTLKQHIRTHKTYPCKVCSKIFLKKTKLTKHLEEHSSKHVGEPQKSLTCNICGKEATTMPALISHMKAHDRPPKSYICSLCSKQFTCKRNLDQHSLIHTGEKPFSCENCGRVFRNRGNMVNHFNICTGKFRFMCSSCGKGFVLKCTYEKHVAEHEGRYSHCCSICHKGFGKSSDLRKHFHFHGVAAQTQPNPCTVCIGNIGCNISKLRESKCICEICGKHVSSKGTMKDHLAFHAGEKNYTCQICSVSYFYKSNLTYHMKTVHLKKLPFPCTLCCKAFSRPGSYKLHMRTHTGEKPYQCKSCGKAFSSSSNYKRHLKCHVTHAQLDNNNKSADEPEV